MRKRYIFVASGIIVAALIGNAVYSAKQAAKYIQVKIAPVSKGDLKSYLSTTGTVKSKKVKDYYGTQGKVSKVYVKVGDTVQQGQMLAELDVQDLSSTVQQAQIQYSNAVLSKEMLKNSNSDINKKIADLNGQIKTIEDSIAKLKAMPAEAAQEQIKVLESQKAQLKQAKDSLKPISSQQFKQADNSISLAKIALDSAKENSEKVKKAIYAEESGTVTSVNLNEGAIYSGAQPALTIQDLKNFKMLLSIGKYDAGRISMGQEALIKDGEKELKGKVSFISPTAHQTVSVSGAETSLNVEVDVLDKESALIVEFENDVDILTGEKKDVLKIPVESIKSDKTGRNYVFVSENGKAVEKEIKTGLQSDLEAEVTDGLKEGDKVILNPNEKITDGSLIIESSGVSS